MSGFEKKLSAKISPDPSVYILEPSNQNEVSNIEQAPLLEKSMPAIST